MSNLDPTPAVGTIGWVDLTVPNASEIRDFYRAVVGWTTGDVDMGGYCDYNMQLPGTEQAVAGICHARGVNTDLPAHRLRARWGLRWSSSMSCREPGAISAGR